MQKYQKSGLFQIFKHQVHCTVQENDAVLCVKESKVYLANRFQKRDNFFKEEGAFSVIHCRFCGYKLKSIHSECTIQRETFSFSFLRYVVHYMTLLLYDFFSRRTARALFKNFSETFGLMNNHELEQKGQRMKKGAKSFCAVQYVRSIYTHKNVIYTK